MNALFKSKNSIKSSVKYKGMLWEFICCDNHEEPEVPGKCSTYTQTEQTGLTAVTKECNKEPCNFNGNISRAYTHLKKGRKHTYNLTYHISYSTTTKHNQKNQKKSKKRCCFF